MFPSSVSLFDRLSRYLGRGVIWINPSANAGGFRLTSHRLRKFIRRLAAYLLVKACRFVLGLSTSRQFGEVESSMVTEKIVHLDMHE